MTSPSDRAAGFTLIELLMVMAILALAVTLMFNRGMRVSPSTQAQAAARMVSGALRTARAEALTTNRSVFFTLDLGHHSYRVGQGPVERVPANLSLGLLTGQEETASDKVGSIRFDPDGGSTGGRVSIGGGDRTWNVGVDWLSGRVSIAQPP